MPYRNTRRKNNRTNRNKRNKRKSRKTQSGGSAPIPSHEGANAFTNLTTYTIDNTNKDAAATYFEKLLGDDVSKHNRIKEIIESKNANELTMLKNQILSLYLQKITKVDFANNLDDVIKNDDTLAKLNSLLSGTAVAPGTNAPGAPGAPGAPAGARVVPPPGPPTSGGGIEFHKPDSNTAPVALKKFYDDTAVGVGKDLTFKNNKTELFDNKSGFEQLFARIGDGLNILFPKDEATQGGRTTTELFTTGDSGGTNETNLINGIYYWAVTDETGKKPLSQFFTIDKLPDKFGIKIKAEENVIDDTGNTQYDEDVDWFNALKIKAGVNGDANTGIDIKVHAVPRSLISHTNEGGYVIDDNPRPLENPANPAHKYAQVFTIKDLIETFNGTETYDLEEFAKIVNKLKAFEISFKIKPKRN